jgi:hypothetical protein
MSRFRGMGPVRRALAAAAVTSAAFAGSPAAEGTEQRPYVFERGTHSERRVVVAALEASGFDWSVVPATITIHIVPGVDSGSAPGHIWLDANLLDDGTFAMGVVQHEYAHQVDYFLFDDALRARLLRLLGGRDWCYGVLGLPHREYGCERFASTLAWAYWPSPENSMKPASARDEAAAMQPQRFRALMTSILRGARP